MLNPVSFYDAAVKAAGYTRADDEATKLASAQGIPSEVAALARDYFYQTQIDGIPYSGDSARAADAMKMAVAYHQHVANECEAAQKLAEGITRAMRHAAEGYLAGQNIDLTADEALKVASLQGDPDLVRSKTAGYAVPGSLHNGGAVDMATVNADQVGRHLATLHNAPLTDTGDEGAKYLNRLAGGAGLAPEHVPAVAQGVAMDLYTGNGHSSIAETQARMRNIVNPAPAAGGKPFGGYGGLALAGGALGLGAMWYMNKKRREAEAMQNSSMALQRAATLPAA